MAINDEMWIIGLGLLFSYGIVYRKYKLLGAIFGSACGMTMMAFNTGNTYAAIGLIITLGSIFIAALDFLYE